MKRVLNIHSAIMVLVFLILALVFLGAGAPQAIAESDGETSALSAASGEVTFDLEQFAEDNRRGNWLD